jgi:hypothetical protein
MIIGLTGYAQSGKDTVANILVNNYGFTRVAFADKIREYLYDMNPMFDSVAGEPMFVKEKVDRDGWDVAKQHPQIRRLLQNSGVSARKIFGKNFWVNQALGPIGIGYPNVVITDVRFTNEADTLKANGAQLWRIKRLGVDAVNSHISEHSMDDYKVDQIFANNGTLKDLEAMVKIRMQGLLV